MKNIKLKRKKDLAARDIEEHADITKNVLQDMEFEIDELEIRIEELERELEMYKAGQLPAKSLFEQVANTVQDYNKSILLLDGPVTIDTERQQEYQPKSKLYQGMKNGNAITSPSRKIQVGYHEGQSITYTEEINIPGGEDSLERDVCIERTGIIRFNEQAGIYFIEAEDGEEIPLEDVEDVEIIKSQV